MTSLKVLGFGDTDTKAVNALMSSIQGDLAFDVGGNFGQSAITLVKNFRRVETFEPCREAFDEMVVKVTSMRVHPHFLAVSDRDGFVTLQETEDALPYGELTTGTALAWGKVTGNREVPAVRLDTLASVLGHPDFVKIDTEGHEIEVIRGGWHVFREDFPRVLIEVHRKAHEQLIHNMLPHYEFERFNHDAYGEDNPWRDEHFWLYGDLKSA